MAEKITPLQVFGKLAETYKTLTVEGAREVIADECVVREADALPVIGGEWKGPQGFVDLIAAIQATYDSTFELEKLLTDDEEWIAMNGRLVGTAGGKPFNIPLVEFWRFKDGKAIEVTPVWHDTKLISDLYHGIAS